MSDRKKKIIMERETPTYKSRKLKYIKVLASKTSIN